MSCPECPHLRVSSMPDPPGHRIDYRITSPIAWACWHPGFLIFSRVSMVIGVRTLYGRPAWCPQAKQETTP